MGASSFTGRDFSRGMHWIGHPGSLVPVVDLGSISVSDDDEPVAQQGMGGGRRVRVHRDRAPRSWQLKIPAAHADDVAHLRTLTTALLPPYQLVTAEAQVSNVMTPEQSMLNATVPGSASLALGGWWPIAGEHTGGGALARLNPGAAFSNVSAVWTTPVPIPPVWTGRSVTASAWLATNATDGAFIHLQWLDSAGSRFGDSTAGNIIQGMDGLRRSTATGKPPAGAVACRVAISYAEVIAQPQVTWTDTPMEWSPGNGADRVVITGIERDTEFAVPDQHSLRRSDWTVTMIEVGP